MISARQALRLSCLCIVTVLATWSAPRLAAGEGAEPSDAQVAFEEGMALMERGDYEEACARLELSVKLEPAMAATYRWAECLEKTGKLASAWRRFTAVSKVARSAGLAERAAVALGRADALESRLSGVAMDVADEVAALPGVRVVLDGTVVAPEQWAMVPVDEGSHTVTVSAKGKQEWVTVVMVAGEGKTTRVAVPALADEPSESVPADGAGEAQRIAGIVVAGAGVVTLGVGTVLALVANSTYRDSDQYCDENRCEPDGLELRETAIDQADIATVLFAVGGGLTAGGVLLWLLAPDGEGPADGGQARPLDLAVTPTGLWLRGMW
ncbi:MAG: hypothetical protein JRI68_15650 [Deltaproteobacteria bacterium]|nr:hypothetical protein [Deltaproteobacteria bacterium]